MSKSGKKPWTRRWLPARGRKLPGHRPGVMNSTETLNAEHLKWQELQGEIAGWMFEPLKLKLAETEITTKDQLSGK